MCATIRSLEGLRGMAALLVVFHHMCGAPPHRLFGSAYLCVDLFFVLSGFVIGGAYGAQLSNPALLRIFMIRRIGRLWPTHIATTLLALAIIHHVPSFGEAIALATMSQGLNLFVDGIGNLVSWSAGDEMYVYLLFGAACFLMRGKARIAAFAVLALSAYALAVWIEAGRACLLLGGCLNGLIHKFGWMRCIAGFFIGALVYEFRDRVVTLTGGRATQLTAFIASLLVVLFANYLPGSALVAPLVFAVLISSLVTDRGPVAHILQTRPAQYLGKVSYSLYLGHGAFLPLIVAVTMGTRFEARLIPYALFLFWVLALAHLLHKYIETPFREWFNAWSRPNSRWASGHAGVE